MFLDDPNLNINTPERNQAKRIYGLCILGSFIPPLNFLLPYIYSKKQNISAFAYKHNIGLLNIQLFVCLLLILLLGIYFFIGLFYTLLLSLAILIYQLMFVVKGYSYAHQGEYYNAFIPFRFLK